MTRLLDFSRNIGMAFAALVSAFALLAVARLGWFSRYVADDFCTAAVTRRLGFLSAQHHWYVSWSGRFGFTFVISALEMAGASVARFVPAICIGALAVTATAAMWRLTSFTGATRPQLPAVALGLGLTATIICTGPDIFQDALWMTGVVTYAAPLALILGWLVLVIARFTIPVRPRDHAAAAALMFAASAFSETLAAILATMLLLAWLAAAPPLRRLLASSLMAATAGALIVAIAPGNLVRAAAFPARPPLLLVGGASIAGAVGFTLDEVQRAGAALCILVAIAFMAGTIGERRLHYGRRKIVLSLVALAAAILEPFAMAYAVMSIPPPPRSLLGPHFLLALAAIGGGWILGTVMQSNRRAVTMSLVAVAIVVLAMIPAATALRTYSQARESVQQFANGWDRLDRALADPAMRGRSVAVTAPIRIGGLFFVTPDRGHWANRCVADYYGLSSIVTGRK